MGAVSRKEKIPIDDPVPNERDQWMAVKVACVSGDINTRESLMKAAVSAIAKARAEGATAAAERIAELEAALRNAVSLIFAHDDVAEAVKVQAQAALTQKGGR